MRYPAYPLVNIDPYFSIWSMSDVLNDDCTRLWTGEPKKLTGLVEVDGECLRFMGGGEARIIPQQSVKVTPLFTSYVFANDKISLAARFWSPKVASELYLHSAPVGYIEYSVNVLDGKRHSITITTAMNETFCTMPVRERNITGGDLSAAGYSVSYMENARQNPLNACGDAVSADWGTYFIAAESTSFRREYPRPAQDTYKYTGQKEESPSVPGANIASVYSADTDTSFSTFVLLAADDKYSIEYMGKKLTGVWRERYADIEELIAWFMSNRELVRADTQSFEDKLLADAAPFAQEYTELLCISYRQVMAAHKAVRSPQGELLWLSKECNSNGCINTVDVSYPSSPLFALYSPELLRGMLSGIFDFASKRVWKYDFAPHDIGTYPWADGQVYALKEESLLMPHRRKLYAALLEQYDQANQMPVEECGNMIIMTYCYFKASADVDYVKTHLKTLTKWADYLVKCGFDLEYQLCTDDFAGHLKRNVNLAVKACVALALFSRLCAEAGEPMSDYAEKAKDFAKGLYEAGSNEYGMMLTLDSPESWSLKYNMVWDKIFALRLFPAEVYEKETACYISHVNEYGVPLDCRKDFTKSDWLMWAATLDPTGEAVGHFAALERAMLADTRDRVPFTDWYDTKSGRRVWMWHRSVQGGLWMPILAAKWGAKE